MNIKKIIAVAFAVFTITPFSASATTLTLADAIGYVAPGVAANGTSDTAALNALLGWANGTDPNPSGGGLTFTLVNTGGAPFLGGAYDSNGGVGGDDTIDLGTGGYAYLMVKYDGAQGSAQFWDISGEVGDLLVPAKDVFGKTHNNYSLFTLNRTSVPDGGSTLALLGLTLAGFGALRRKIAN